MITSPQLIQAAFRQRTLSFDPVILEFNNLFGFSPKATEIVWRNHDNEKVDSYMLDLHKSMHESLIIGPALYEMNGSVLRTIGKELNSIGREIETKPLFLWLRNTLSVASSAALFGSNHIFAKDQSLVDAYWDFETNILPLMAYPYPALTARKAYNGRARIQTALRAYFNAGHYNDEDVSAMVKGRARVGAKWGLPIDEVAISELGTLFASTSNASPTLFWMFCFVFSDPKLIQDLQKELSAVVEKNGDTECVIDIRKFSQHCPLLVSSYQETMRLMSAHTGNRFVLADTVLKYEGEGPDAKGARTYLLKKGFMLNVPSSIAHNSPEVWGPTVNVYDARRFLKRDETDADSDVTKDQKKLQKTAYFPFGGGRSLCPGRHFVFAEALGTVAALVLGYEITGEDGDTLKMPIKRQQNMSDGTKKPVGEEAKMRIQIRRRVGWEKINWSFVVGAKDER
ncbi:MAG: hypothetical protein M1827_007570 [Pycnora praestabilis]|nr:MAG: hypothetical protein M1827_007570 [Pycnora praestabilis]